MNSNLNSDIARPEPVSLFKGWGHHLFALTMIGLGISGLVSGDFASVWQQIPIADLPARAFFAYATAVVELATGLGLFFRQSLAISSRVLFVFLSLWLVLLKVPGIVAAPSIEAMWLGFGEIAVMVAGGWILFATYNGNDRSTFLVGRKAIRNARVLFAIALPMIGLSHFFYADETAKFVPAWLPLRHGWAYLTGAGSLAACIGILTGVFARLAAALEAAMLVIITVLVWTPWLTPAPVTPMQITAFLISSAIASGAWIVADSYRDTGWLAIRNYP
jgi:uncharacterized membrane protein YphA (DoxX/SURF4 family)